MGLKCGNKANEGHAPPGIHKSHQHHQDLFRKRVDGKGKEKGKGNRCPGRLSDAR